MPFWSLQFLPKNERSSKNEFIRSYFGRIHGLTICFQNYLTFRIMIQGRRIQGENQPPPQILAKLPRSKTYFIKRTQVICSPLQIFRPSTVSSGLNLKYQLKLYIVGDLRDVLLFLSHPHQILVFKMKNLAFCSFFSDFKVGGQFLDFLQLPVKT